MRKSILIFSALCASAVAFGQLKVYSNGGIDIGQLKMYSNGSIVVNPSGIPLAMPLYQLRINTNYTTGLFVEATPPSDSGVKKAFVGISGYVTGFPKDVLGDTYIVGVKGNSSLTYENSSFVSFGVMGKGGGSERGRNIGVLGYLNNTSFKTEYGAGVFGTVDFNQSFRDFTQPYAGFFAGNVKITNMLDVVGTAFPADYNHYQHLGYIEFEEAHNLFKLTPVKYNLKQRYTAYTDSTGKVVELGEFDEKSQLFTNTHYGLIAQEVMEFFPDLVYKDENGDLSVDYVALIPILITVIKDVKKEFRAEIDSIKDSYMSIDQRNSAPGRPPQETHGFAVEAAALFQNTPNPFTESTEIAFYLPQSVTNAMLCIYDMNGRQLSQDIINARGNATFIVNGNEFGAGMYLYSLIADGQIVDTKRMILTR